MEVILREKVENLGNTGDIIKVSDGYARNYLLPKKLALQSTLEAKKIIEEEKKRKAIKEEKEKKDALKLAERIEKISCTIPSKAGEEDKLFGSVTSSDIADALKNEGVEIDKKKIELEEPIKSLGVYSIPIKLHSEVTANAKIWVVKE
ncbi:MAG: 50S ribosomal protein L9 [Candidatus Firestonebacteria bacterium]